MRGVEFSGRGIAPHPTSKIGSMIGGQFPGHQRRRVGVELQLHDRPPRFCPVDRIAPVGALADQVGISRVAVLGAVPLERGQPGLVDELIETRRRRCGRLCAGIVPALTLGCAEQEAEVHARRLRRTLNGGLDHAPDRLNGHSRSLGIYG